MNLLNLFLAAEYDLLVQELIFLKELLLDPSDETLSDEENEEL